MSAVEEKYVVPALRRPFPLSTGVARVTKITTVTPQMACLTLHAETLDGFPVEQPGEVVTLLWPAEGEPLVLPEVGWRFANGAGERQHARNYTVRRCRADAAEIDIDFFLHGKLGPAARWAEEVEIGDEVGFAGPRLHWTADRDHDAQWSLLIADETGLPGLLAIAEHLPPGHKVIAIAEVAGPQEEQHPHTARCDLDLRYVHRGTAAPGKSTAIIDALRRLDLPDGQGRVWGGGEALVMRDARRHLTGERGLPSRDVALQGYWKHRDTPEWD